MSQFCPVCGETRCARADAECKTPCIGHEARQRGIEGAHAAYAAAFAQQRESAMARSVYGSAEDWVSSKHDWYGSVVETQAPAVVERLRQVQAQDDAYIGSIDPDGPPTPLPKPPERTAAAPTHDFLAALYRPYQAPI